jgi:hypothetical protein
MTKLQSSILLDVCYLTSKCGIDTTLVTVLLADHTYELLGHKGKGSMTNNYG